MRQLMVLSNRRLEWRETAAPKLLRATDALVRQVALLTCVADVAYLRSEFPLRGESCSGHEFVADVIEIGDEQMHGTLMLAVAKRKELFPDEINMA